MQQQEGIYKLAVGHGLSAKQQQLVFDDVVREHVDVQRSSKSNLKILAIFSVTAAVVVFTIVAYVSYKYTVRPVNFEDIRLVKSEVGPVKIVPAEPGGEKFSNQNISVYEAIEKNHVKASTVKKVANKTSATKMANSQSKPAKKVHENDVFSVLQ